MVAEEVACLGSGVMVPVEGGMRVAEEVAMVGVGVGVMSRAAMVKFRTKR